MVRISGHHQKTFWVGLAIVMIALGWIGLAYATQPTQVPPGQVPTCGNPIYGITITANLLWTQALLGDSVSAQSKQVSITVSCPQPFSIVLPFASLNFLSQNGKFQVVATLAQTGTQIGSPQTTNPGLVAAQAVSVAIYANPNLAVGFYQLTTVISEQGCYSAPYICGGWPFPSLSYSQVGSFTCSFVIASTVQSGATQNC
jgi:hypothetical protein